ncbi:phospholipase A1 EG1, chloroplastic/mitochondrial-like [Triticum dicoccoides]|uniref:phospholipase A1 EG1, chloroplastic/mitochondrial-like n=1 Tax=Triticum dicoccoides TaxID=85692 RepID=UPI00188F78D5|nr:phospholipase A1 EG1, chloroplastic/mitochondrial-like [Triticum dicoccoides]
MAFAPATTTTSIAAAAAMALKPQCAGRQPMSRAARCRAAAALTAEGCASTSAIAAAPVAPRRGARRTPSVAGMWRQLQGGDDWEGLLGLDGPAPALRSEVARYGELVDACYKAFDLDRASRRYLNCKYGKERMLEEVGMAGAGYEVTKYIYAAPDVMTVPTMEASTSGRGRWIGYVAVSTDEMTRRLGRRDVLVSFRGTVTPAEWMANFMSSLEPARLDPCDPRPDVMVESGFLSLYTSADKTCRFGGAGSCREQLLREVSRLVDAHSSSSKKPGEEVSVTLAGHSMGSALALLLAYDLAELGLNRAAPVTVFSFGGPRVGNAAFKARCDELGVKALRVANVHDPITKLPGILLNEATTGVLRPWRASCYTHVGVELPLDYFSARAPAAVHDLGTYIALLKKPAAAAGAAGDGGGGGVVGKVLDFVGRQRAGALQWQYAALQMGGLVQTLGLI